VWARACIDDLFDRQEIEPHQAASLRAQIISLALENRLATPFTAFVAIDQEVAVADGKARRLRVAQPLPQGLQREGFENRPVHLKARPPLPGTSGAVNPMAAPSPHFRAMKATIADSYDLAPVDLPHVNMAGPQDGGQAPVILVDPEETLRWLARTQDLDGSWGGDAERTAAALLAFIRAGHTTRAGSFRQAVRRAYEWLASARPAGFAAFLAALALAELARATGQAAHQDSAAKRLAGLPDPASPLEGAVLGRLGIAQAAGEAAPDPLLSLDDLRLAAVAGLPREVSGALLHGPQRDLARTLAAALIA
jgi:hypothetical protein